MIHASFGLVCSTLCCVRREAMGLLPEKKTWLRASHGLVLRLVHIMLPTATMRRVVGLDPSAWSSAPPPAYWNQENLQTANGCYSDGNSPGDFPHVWRLTDFFR